MGKKRKITDNNSSKGITFNWCLFVWFLFETQFMLLAAYNKKEVV